MSCPVRLEQPGDEPGIRHVLKAAFPTDLESRLVDDLRNAGRLTMSFVAVCDGEIVGHAGFSPVTLNNDVIGLGLAPVAVLPSHHRRGVGSHLIRAGLDACRKQKIGCVVVLGDPAYYGRFGFTPAKRWNLTDEFRGGDAFQAMELIPGSIPTGGGLVRYAPEFAIVAE